MQNKSNKLISLIIVLVITLTLCFGFVLIVSKSRVKTLSNKMFVAGSLDGGTGNNVESETMLVTKDFIQTQGLRVYLDFDAEVSYSIFWYDVDRNFIDNTPVSDESFTSAFGSYRVWAKIVIIPDKHTKITAFNKHKYLDKIKVVVDRFQDEYVPLKIESIKLNLRDGRTLYVKDNCVEVERLVDDTQSIINYDNTYLKSLEIKFNYNVKGKTLLTYHKEQSTPDDLNFYRKYVEVGLGSYSMPKNSDTLVISNLHLAFQPPSLNPNTGDVIYYRYLHLTFSCNEIYTKNGLLLDTVDYTFAIKMK